MTDAEQTPPDLVGALIHDGQGRIFIHQRSHDRSLFPGAWDIVGGAVEPGETADQALKREVLEETSWQVHSVSDWVADRLIPVGGQPLREVVALVAVIGGGEPVLEAGKHIAYAWVGPDDAIADANIEMGHGDHIPSLLAAGFVALKRTQYDTGPSKENG